MGKLGMTGEGRRGGRAPARLALGLAAAVLLAGCESNRNAYAPEPSLTVEQRYPITVAENRVVLEVPVSPGAERLTAAQRNEVANFISGYRAGGTGALQIRAPSGSRNEAAALNAIDEIREMVVANNIPGAAVSYSVYSGRKAGSPYPPVLLAYTGLKAVSPECGDWSENISANYKNKQYPNFGCATQKNLAAMIDNPRDLVTPRGMDPSSAERRQTVRDKYVLGEPTATKTDDENKGEVSKVGQ